VLCPSLYLAVPLAREIELAASLWLFLVAGLPCNQQGGAPGGVLDWGP
jgi:hypothetical protein